MVHPKTALILASIIAAPTFLIVAKNSEVNIKNGAEIRVNTDAKGFWNNLTNYSWTIDKKTDTFNIQLRPGESTTTNYTISINRDTASQDNSKGVDGNVCIKNNGKQATQNLKITNIVQSRSKWWHQFTDINGTTQVTTPNQVDAGKTSCTPFKIDFDASPNTRYRVRTVAMITNSAKKQSPEESTIDTDSFEIPKTTKTVATDATVTDSDQCPQNFSCTPTQTGPWIVTDTTTINYSVLLKNDTSACELPVTFTNTATLVENTTQNNVSSKTSVPINTGPC